MPSVPTIPRPILGRFNFAIKLHPDGPLMPIIMDFANLRRPVPIHIRIASEHMDVLKFDGPRQPADVAFTQAEALPMFEGGAATAYKPRRHHWILSWWSLLVLLPLVFSFHMFPKSQPQIQKVSLSTRLHDPNPLPDVPWGRLDLDPLDPQRMMPLWHLTTNSLRYFYRVANQILLISQDGNHLFSPPLDIPTFFNNLSDSLSQIGKYQEDIALYTSYVGGKEGAKSGMTDMELEAEREEYRVDYGRIPEVIDHLVDSWYHLANYLPADLSAVIASLKTLEQTVLKSKTPKQIIQAVTATNFQHGAWSLDGLAGKLYTILDDMRNDLETLQKALDLPVRALEVLNLDDPHLGLSWPGGHAPIASSAILPIASMLKSFAALNASHTIDEPHHVLSWPRGYVSSIPIASILKSFAALNASHIIDELEHTIDEANWNIRRASKLLHRSVEVADLWGTGDVEFIVGNATCSTDCCLASPEVLASQIHAWVDVLEKLTEEHRRYWTGWKKLMEKAAVGSGKPLRHFANPAFL